MRWFLWELGNTGKYIHSLKGLVIAGGSIADNICNVAVQYPAEVIDRGGAQGLIFTQAVDGGTGQLMNMNQRIGRFLRIFQCIPEGFICNHSDSSFLAMYLNE